MKKNLPLILIVLLLVSILIYLKYNKSKSNFEATNFNIENVDNIGSISIADKNGYTVRLSRNGKDWTINEKNLADRNKMLVLLQTLNKLQIEMPVGDSMRKMAIQNLRMSGKEIIVKDKNGTELKTFYLGGQYGAGNTAILSENGIVSPDPYLIKIPGIKTTDLIHRFPASPEAWYSTEVFSTTIEKIKRISILFHEKPEMSFHLAKDEDLIKIDPIIDSLKIPKPLNKERVLQFLLEFESKNFEVRVKNDSAVSYIKKSKPIYTIELEDVFNSKRYIKLYRIPSEFQGMDLSGGVRDALGKKLPFNIEKYWAYNSYTKEYVLAQHYVFGPVILPYSYFFEESK